MYVKPSTYEQHYLNEIHAYFFLIANFNRTIFFKNNVSVTYNNILIVSYVKFTLSICLIILPARHTHIPDVDVVGIIIFCAVLGYGITPSWVSQIAFDEVASIFVKKGRVTYRRILTTRNDTQPLIGRILVLCVHPCGGPAFGDGVFVDAFLKDLWLDFPTTNLFTDRSWNQTIKENK